MIIMTLISVSVFLCDDDDDDGHDDDFVTYLIPLWWNHKFPNLMTLMMTMMPMTMSMMMMMMTMMMVMMMILSLISYPYGGTINFQI